MGTASLAEAFQMVALRFASGLEVEAVALRLSDGSFEISEANSLEAICAGRSPSHWDMIYARAGVDLAPALARGLAVNVVEVGDPAFEITDLADVEILLRADVADFLKEAAGR